MEYLNQFLERPLLTKNAGFAPEEEFLQQHAVKVTADTPPATADALFPVCGREDDRVQYLVNTREMHTLILGTTGAGKTRRCLAAGVSAAMFSKEKPSMMILDLKGELRQMTEPFARKMGYECICLDFTGAPSDGYDPLALARECRQKGDEAGAEEALTALAELVAPSQGEHRSTDPFWDRTTRQVVQAAALYLLQKERRGLPANFPAVVDLIGCIFAREDAPAEFINDVARACGRESTACRLARSALSGSEKTLQNVATSVLSAVNRFLRNKTMLEIMKKPMSPLLKDPSARPVAVYFRVSETGTESYDFARMVFSQLYQRLSTRAGAGRLPRGFEFFLEEMANGAPLPDLGKIASVARAKGIRLHLVLQTLSQLEETYGAAQAQTIVNCCGATIVMRTQDPDAACRVARMAGVNFRGRELISEHQLAHLSCGQALILLPVCRPYMAQVCDVSRIPWLKTA